MTTFTVELRAERPCVGVPMTAELAHWDRVNAHVPRIYGALAAAGGIPSGGPIYQYHRLRTAADPMDITVSVPVPTCIEIGDGFDTGVIPAGRYLIARPEGGPDVLARIHQEMGNGRECRASTSRSTNGPTASTGTHARSSSSRTRRPRRIVGSGPLRSHTC